MYVCTWVVSPARVKCLEGGEHNSAHLAFAMCHDSLHDVGSEFVSNYDVSQTPVGDVWGQVGLVSPPSHPRMEEMVSFSLGL